LDVGAERGVAGAAADLLEAGGLAREGRWKPKTAGELCAPCSGGTPCNCGAPSPACTGKLRLDRAPGRDLA
jgi:hypothetical protein